MSSVTVDTPHAAAVRSGSPQTAAARAEVAASIWHWPRWSLLARMQKRVWLATALITCLGLMVVAIDTRLDWQRSESRQLGQLQQLSQLLSEQTVRALNIADQVGWAIQKDVAAGRPIADLRDYMPPLKLPEGLVSGISMLDANGQLIASDRPFRRQDLSEREYFQVLSTDASVSVYVAKPSISRINGQGAMPISRRLQTPDGRFAGVVNVVINPSYFERIFRSLGGDQHYQFALLGKDGVIRVRYSHGEKSQGQNLSNWTLFASIFNRESGTLDAISPVDGVPRLYAFQVLNGYPMAVVAAIEKSAALAQTMNHIWVEGCVLLALLALLWALAYYLHRQIALSLRHSDALHAINQQLEKRDKVKDALFHQLGRELREPVQDLIDKTQSLQMQARLYDHAALAEQAHAATQSLARRMTGMVDVARLEMGLAKPDIASVQIGNLLHDVVAQEGLQAHERGVRVIFRHGAGDLPQAYVQTDPHWLRKLVERLVDNAVRHSQSGQVVELMLDAEPKQGHWHVWITDQAGGLPSTSKAHLFGRVWQDRLGQPVHVPSGLTLSMVLTAAEMLGVRIHVDSLRGQGTRFELVVPATPGGGEQPGAKPPLQLLPSRMADSLPPRQVALPEPDPQNR